MPIRNTPPAAPKAAARRPDLHPRFAPVLAEAWQTEYLKESRPFAPMAEGVRWWHSWAATCARAFQYRVQRYDTIRSVLENLDSFKPDSKFAGLSIETFRDREVVDMAEVLEDLTPEARALITAEMVTEPLTVADQWRFHTGDVIHRVFQDAIEAAYPDTAKREVKAEVRSDSQGSGRLDLIIDTPFRPDDPEIEAGSYQRIAVEIKTINGFGFKRMIGDRGNPEGPRFSSVVQLALNAHAAHADEAVLIVLAMENLSPAVLAKMLSTMRLDPAGQEWRRFCAEYTFTKEEFTAVAEAEQRRVARILELNDEGLLLPRAIPDPELPHGARIVDPSKGTWHLTIPQEGGGLGVVDAGTTFHCGYCENRQRCIADGAS